MSRITIQHQPLSLDEPAAVTRATSWLKPHDYVFLTAFVLAMGYWLLTGWPILPIRPWAVPFLLRVGEQLLVMLVALFMIRTVRCTFRGELAKPTFMDLVARHVGVERVVCAGRYLISLVVVMTIYTSLKQAIPLVHRRTFDQTLSEIERFLHFGLNPAWAMANADLPMWWLILLDASYYLWFPILTLAAAYFLTHGDLRKRDHYLASFLGIMVVGVLLGTAFPSHGPRYVDAATFPPREMPFCAVTQSFLAERCLELNSIGLRGEGGLWFGCGLMALPSIHVAACALYVFFFWREGPFLRTASIAYALVIFIGSVTSGWHYAVDGYVGALLSLLVMRMTGLLPGALRPRNVSFLA